MRIFDRSCVNVPRCGVVKWVPSSRNVFASPVKVPPDFSCIVYLYSCEIKTEPYPSTWPSKSQDIQSSSRVSLVTLSLPVPSGFVISIRKLQNYRILWAYNHTYRCYFWKHHNCLSRKAWCMAMRAVGDYSIIALEIRQTVGDTIFRTFLYLSLIHIWRCRRAI